MAGTPARQAADGAVFHARFDRWRSWVVMLVPLLLIVAVLFGRAPGTGSRPLVALGVGASDLTPAELMASAASEFERATALGGAGYTFTIVQRTSIDARPGGPLIDIPDPTDRHASLGQTDHYDLTSYVERGAAAPGGFWLEVRDGPVPGAAPDFEGSAYQLGAIVRDGKTYRNEGKGWYPTSDPPGIGLDPRTASLLPTMLRSATNARSAVPGDVQPGAAVALQATTKVADLPGIIAVDGETFTELTKPLELAFDDQGRLTAIHAIARNTNLDDYDMVVDTVIVFSYPLFAPDIPKPDPIIDPDATTQGEG